MNVNEHLVDPPKTRVTQMQSKKAFSEVSLGHPFPNYFVGEWEVPAVCRCVYDGNDFFVLNTNDIQTLYHNGSFGVSNLTFRGPQVLDEGYTRRPYYKKMVERIGFKRKLLEQVDSNENTTNNGKDIGSASILVGKSDNCDIVTINQIAETVISAPLWENNFSNITTMQKSQKISSGKEKLMLMAEEVIFLSFGVGCLTIQTLSGETISYTEVWKQLVAKDPEFIISYAVYHYFRSKNWVPKLGISFGGSFILYKVGPEYYHAAYIVYIIGFPTRPRPNWREMYSFQRLAKHVGKNVVVCDVKIPKDFSYINSEPLSIFRLKIHETCMYRWKPASQEIY